MSALRDDAIAAYCAELASYEARIAHSVDRLIPFKDFRTYGMDRALVAAGRMFGLGKRLTRKVVGRRAAGREGMIDPGRALELVPSVEPFCGYVYTARMVHYPHIIKIGFSRQPDVRERQLGYESKSAVRMEHVEVGTLFEEAYRLLVLGRYQINTEWFFDPAFPIVSMPDFLSAGFSLDYWQRAGGRAANGSWSRAIGAHAEIYREIIEERVH